MDFVDHLTNRIRKQIGLEFSVSEEFSFFQPSGSEHLLQFFFKCFPDEYWELDPWDRHHLFLCDISARAGLEFELDDNGEYATIEIKNGRQAKSVHAVMDLRDDYLIIVYYFGDSKQCLKLNQLLINSAELNTCYLGMGIMEQLICELEEINRIDYDFEQLNTMFLKPVCIRGSVTGEPAQLLYGQYITYHKPFFNISSIAGRLSDESQGNLVFHSSGLVQIDDCRLSGFMEKVNLMFLLIRAKYKHLVDQCLMEWKEEFASDAVGLKGNVIEFCFQQPVERLDGLIRYLVKGDRTQQLLGISERVSRKLWSIKTMEIEKKVQLEGEVSDTMVRIYLKKRATIPLLDQVENYIRKHISAEIEGPA